jgi:hypothetical protein
MGGAVAAEAPVAAEGAPPAGSEAREVTAQAGRSRLDAAAAALSPGEPGALGSALLALSAWLEAHGQALRWADLAAVAASSGVLVHLALRGRQRRALGELTARDLGSRRRLRVRLHALEARGGLVYASASHAPALSPRLWTRNAPDARLRLRLLALRALDGAADGPLALPDVLRGSDAAPLLEAQLLGVEEARVPPAAVVRLLYRDPSSLTQLLRLRAPHDLGLALLRAGRARAWAGEDLPALALTEHHAVDLRHWTRDAELLDRTLHPPATTASPAALDSSAAAAATAERGLAAAWAVARRVVGGAARAVRSLAAGSRSKASPPRGGPAP